MRTHIVTAVSVLALAVAGCSERSSESRSESGYGGREDMAPTADVAPPPGMAPSEADMERAAQGPGIAPTAAPGVAFNYRYAFRLPGERVAAIQEAHAASCEELGISRCRITGMRYRVINETDIEAMLAFKLDPAIARAFGRDAGATVAQADGMLIDAEISGVDAGAAIAESMRENARLQQDIAQIEARLRAGNVSPGERAQLDAQLAQLRNSLRATEDRRQADEESLATTPMVFEYGSGDVIPGFDGRTPIRNALSDAGTGFMSIVAFFIVVIGVLLPFLAVGGVAWALWRAFRKRRGEAASPSES